MASNTIEFAVEWGETDAAGIVFYPNYFRWFDRATHALFRSINLPLDVLMEQEGYSPPLAEVGCRFFSPLRYNDQIRVKTSVTELKERTFRLEHELYRGEELVGKGFELRAWINLRETGEGGKLRTTAIPPHIAEKLR